MTPLQAYSRDLAGLVARASPAVVGVERLRAQGQAAKPAPPRAGGLGGREVPPQLVVGQGSGLVLSGDGYVLTNAHVAGGGPARVRLSGSRAAPATLVGADERTDLAVLRVEARDLPVLAVSERRLDVGEVVVAIGNPLGFERSVTAGVVSALYRNLPAPRGAMLEGLVQTDVSINPGNSGGPLLDAWGEVVGITTAMLPWARGIGFAIPGHTASWIASVLIRHGAVRRPFLGIAARGEDLEPAVAREVGHVRGVRVLEVVADSPARAAGLVPGDLLVGVNGRPLQTLDDLQRAMVLSGETDLALELVRGEARRALAIRPRPHGQVAA